MQRISTFTPEQVIEYNLRDGGTAVSIFADTQTYRVQMARDFIASILLRTGDGVTIIEPGCSAGDISGPFAERNKVIGIDVTPAAAQLSRERYPAMEVREGKIEDVAPEPCEILVLCEFLEHIPDPLGLVREWLPLAKYAVIGHPINDPGGIEPGHLWSYQMSDYFNWLTLGGHTEIETREFSGPFPQMVMGASANES